MKRPTCEVCEQAESTPPVDHYDDLDLCAMCRHDLDEQREEVFMREWLGFDAVEPGGTIN